MKKKSLQGKIKEFENFMKIREKSGNFENPVLIRWSMVSVWLLVVCI